MIVGLGNDLVDIRRIEQSIERFGERFLARVFTTGELATARARTTGGKALAAHLAKRFAAKEAAVKALDYPRGTGVSWRDIEVFSQPNGRPGLRLSGAAARFLAEALPAGHAPRLHLTLTDEWPYAQAVVIVEALPGLAAEVDEGHH